MVNRMPVCSAARRLSAVLLIVLFAPFANPQPSADSAPPQSYRLFPWLYFNAPKREADEPNPLPPVYGPRSEELTRGASESGQAGAEQAADEKAKALERIPALAGNQIVAFYGKPGASTMGILGEYSKEKLATLLEAYAKLYDDANGELGVIPAFHIIYGTVWPEGNIGLLSASVVEEYVNFAAERGWLVFLDHQIGKYSVEEAMRALLPFLRYPNVHLAIDPEWRTLLPMKEIGSISGAEINEAQRMMDEYLRERGLPGIRMLLVHQFAPRMITQREQVRATFDRVVLVHNADGFGSPELKRYSYRYNAEARNMPVKGFKLFLEPKVAGAGADRPLMKPEEVLALDPMPSIIMYQ